MLACAAILSSIAAVASAAELNVSGTWNANYHCEHGWCAGQNFPAPGVVLVQAPGSKSVYNGEGKLIGTLNGNELASHGGSPGEYQYDEVQIFSADGTSWTGPLSDSNGTSGTDTGVRVGGTPAEETAKKENEAKEKGKRASATSVSCYVPLLTAFAAWECTATVADASGSQPPGTPTGNVGFSVNAGFNGGFIGSHECALKPSQSGPTAYCTILFVPAVEVPVGSPPPITASYPGSSAFRVSASSGQSSTVHEEPNIVAPGCGSGQAASVHRAVTACVLPPGCPAAQTASVHFGSLAALTAPARIGAVAPASTRVITVGNPKLVRKLHLLGWAAATKRAVALLKPSKTSRITGVRLYGLPAPLAAGTTITEATLGVRSPIVLPVKLKEKAWIYWENLEPLARYEHPSVVLVLSARGGRQIARASFATYPEVNGRPAAFVTQSSRRYLIYARNPGTGHPRRLSKAQVAALLLVSKDALAALHAGKKAHKADTTHSTLITLVDHINKGPTETFTNEEAAVSSAFEKHGVSAQAASSVNGLAVAVQGAAAEGKTNITIFLDGHGAADPSLPHHEWEGTSTLPTVALGPVTYHTEPNGTVVSRQEGGAVTSADLRAIAQAHPEIQFNFIIDSCHSGRFVDPLKQEPNIGTVMTSAGAVETSSGATSLERTSGPNSSAGGRGLVITPAKPEPGAGSVDPAPRPQATLTTPNGEGIAVVGDQSGNGVSPFTAGVVASVNQAFIGQGAGADLTAVLADARTLLPTYDIDAITGHTQPSPDPTPAPPATCPAPTAAETPSGGWFTGP